MDGEVTTCTLDLNSDLTQVLSDGDTSVAVFAPHPGAPDPDGRDENNNAKDLQNCLRNLRRNMRRGNYRDLQSFLKDQGWKQQQINEYLQKIRHYVNVAGPDAVDAGRISNPNLIPEMIKLLIEMGVQP